MRKNLAQKLIADQFWPQGTAQDRQSAFFHDESGIKDMRARIVNLRILRVIWHHGDHCPSLAGFFRRNSMFPCGLTTSQALSRCASPGPCLFTGLVQWPDNGPKQYCNARAIMTRH